MRQFILVSRYFTINESELRLYPRYADLDQIVSNDMGMLLVCGEIQIMNRIFKEFQN
jgi:hypothetical protein